MDTAYARRKTGELLTALKRLEARADGKIRIATSIDEIDAARRAGSFWQNQLLRAARKRRFPSVGFASEWNGNSAFFASAHRACIKDKEFRAIATPPN